MSYKRATSYDAQEMIEQLSEIRDTVSAERKKRLAKEKQKSAIPSFKSGQEHAKKRHI